MTDDGKLLQAVRRMDKEALTQIFDLYALPLYRYALRYCGDPILADQIVGDAFAKFLDQIAAGNGPLHNLRAYLYEIAYHLVIDELRHSSHSVPLELADQYWHSRTSVVSNIEERMEMEKILEAMQSLSADQRHVIILRTLEGFSIGEIAVILGKSRTSVKVIHHRALKMLRRALETNNLPAPLKSPALSVASG